jgi:hypothetical protein
MVRTATTKAQAEAIAAELRAIHAGTDWKVNVYPPRYRGDFWLIFVE